MKWKTCIQTPFKNCEQIYPIQQNKIAKLLNVLTINSNVKRVIVFGSSVTARCHIDSDVDIYVELEYDEKHIINQPLEFVFDLWTNFTVDDRLRNEILSTGVIVYG